MSIERVTETTCPRCLMPYAIHEGDEVTTVCQNILKKMETAPSWPPVSLHQGGTMNDIEAAARALLEAMTRIAGTKQYSRIAVEANALRSTLAHAARGEPVRCWRDVEGTLPARRDGDKVARVDTAPPATGKPWCRLCCGPHIGRDHVSTPYADEPPATGEAGTRGEVFSGYERERAAFDAWWATVADTAGVPLNEVEERKARLLAWQAFYYRALPEAREGGRG